MQKYMKNFPKGFSGEFLKASMEQFLEMSRKFCKDISGPISKQKLRGNSEGISGRIC